MLKVSEQLKVSSHLPLGWPARCMNELGIIWIGSEKNAVLSLRELCLRKVGEFDYLEPSTRIFIPPFYWLCSRSSSR